METNKLERRKNFLKNEYIDIDTGEILQYKKIKYDEIEVVKKESKIYKDNYSKKKYEQIRYYIRRIAEQRSIW